MGTAAYSIHCWLITRLYVFYHKRYGIDDTHRLTLLLRILYGFPCATRFPVPYRNNVISLVHHNNDCACAYNPAYNAAAKAFLCRIWRLYQSTDP